MFVNIVAVQVCSITCLLSSGLVSGLLWPSALVFFSLPLSGGVLCSGALRFLLPELLEGISHAPYVLSELQLVCPLGKCSLNPAVAGQEDSLSA